MDLWHPQIDFGAFQVATWTVFGRVPAVLAILALALHARRFAGTSRALVAGSCFLAGVAAGTTAFHGIVGALAGGLLGWDLGLRAQGVRLPYAFVATRTLLLLVGFGRIGCLLAGCCFGMPTDLAWGVAYPAGSFAHHLHLDLGWIAPGGLSLAVHPVAAYESLALLLAAVFLPAVRRRVRDDRALALWTAAAYLLLRAALDPLRGMVNTPASLHPVGPLSLAQWIYLGAAACLVAVGGMYHLDWRWVGIGFGGRLGLGSMHAHDRVLIPLGHAGFLMPGLYFRLGPPVFGVEIGTGARDQFQPGVFSAVRLTFDRNELRVGWLLSREAPLANSQYYVDARFRLGDGYRLLLRVDIPASARVATGMLGVSFGF